MDQIAAAVWNHGDFQKIDWQKTESRHCGCNRVFYSTRSSGPRTLIPSRISEKQIGPSHGVDDFAGRSGLILRTVLFNTLGKSRLQDHNGPAVLCHRRERLPSVKKPAQYDLVGPCWESCRSFSIRKRRGSHPGIRPQSVASHCSTVPTFRNPNPPGFFFRHRWSRGNKSPAVRGLCLWNEIVTHKLFPWETDPDDKLFANLALSYRTAFNTGSICRTRLFIMTNLRNLPWIMDY